MIETLNQ